MKRRIMLMLSAVLTVAVLSGCGAQDTTADTASGQTSDGGDYPMTFDNYGREVTISEQRTKLHRAVCGARARGLCYRALTGKSQPRSA